jgi:putative peptidoglycan lipid II flippase
MTRSSVIRSVGLMMLAALVGKFLLVIRQPIIAAYFGASDQTDAYNVAMTIVAMLLSIGVSPIGSVLVPVYVKHLHQDPAGGKRVVRQVLSIYLIILSAVLLVAYLAAPGLVRLYAPGFGQETRLLAERLTRILGLFAVASGLVGYLGQVLTAHEEFWWVAAGPIVTALIVIALLVSFGSGHGIEVLAWAMVAGHTVQVFILGFTVRSVTGHLGLSGRIGEAIRSLGMLSGWVLLGRLVGQANHLIDRNLLSFLGEGSIASLEFARSIYLLPFSIFVTGITRVIIANFSWDVAQENRRELQGDLSLSFRLAAFFMIPTTAGLLLLREPIVRLFYQRGAFDELDAKATIAALAFLAIGLFPRAVVFVYARLLLAWQRADWFCLLNVAGLLAHAGASVALVPRVGHVGAALGVSAGDIAMAAVGYLLARRRGFELTRDVMKCVVKVALSSLVMGCVLWGLMWTLASRMQLVALLVVMVVLGSAVFLAAGALLRLRELELVRRLVLEQVHRGGPRAQ